MSYEDITIAQAREIAALFGAQKPEPLAVYIGKRVLVRDSTAGVYAGVVEAVSGAAVTLRAGARQLWQWGNGGACPSIAVRGIRLSATCATKISPPSSGLTTCAAACWIGELADEAWATIDAQPGWVGAE